MDTSIVVSTSSIPTDPTGPVNPALMTTVKPILGIDGQFHVPAVVMMAPLDRGLPTESSDSNQSKLERLVSNSYDLDDAASTCVNFDDRSIVGGMGDVGGELVGEEEGWGEWKDDDEASTSSNDEDQSDMLQVSESAENDIELAESAATNEAVELEEKEGMRRMDSEVIAQHLQQLGEEMVNSLEEDIDKVPVTTVVSAASDTGSDSTAPQCMKRPRQPSLNDALPLTVENVSTCQVAEDARLKIPRLSSNWSTCATMGDDEEKSSICTLDESASLRVNTSLGSLVSGRSSLIGDDAGPTPEPQPEQMDEDPEDPGIVMNVAHNQH